MTEPQSLTGYERDNGAGWNVPGNLDVQSLSFAGTPFTPSGPSFDGQKVHYVLLTDTETCVLAGPGVEWLTLGADHTPDEFTISAGLYAINMHASIEGGAANFSGHLVDFTAFAVTGSTDGEAYAWATVGIPAGLLFDSYNLTGQANMAAVDIQIQRIFDFSGGTPDPASGGSGGGEGS